MFGHSEEDSADKIFETTMAEIAFLFVMAMFLLFTLSNFPKKEIKEKKPFTDPVNGPMPSFQKGIDDKLKLELAHIRKKEKCSCDVEALNTQSQSRTTVAVPTSKTSDCKKSKKNALFASGDPFPNKGGKRCLDKVCPRLIEYVWLNQAHIGNVRIVGHASSEYRKPGLCRGKNECNYILSTKRSFNVWRQCYDFITKMEYIYTFNTKMNTSISEQELIEFYDDMFTPTGLGSRHLVKKKNGDENKEFSRRVEFTIIYKKPQPKTQGTAKSKTLPNPYLKPGRQLIDKKKLITNGIDAIPRN